MRTIFIFITLSLLLTGCDTPALDEQAVPTVIETFTPHSDISETATPTNIPADYQKLIELKARLRIAFTAEDWNLYFWNGEVLKNLSVTGGPFSFLSLSPDGRKIVYIKLSDYLECFDIWSINSDGTGNHRIIDATKLMEMIPGCGGISVNFWLSWLTDESFLMNWDASPNIYRVDVSTQQVEYLLSIESVYRLALSPDKMKLAIVTDDSILIYNLSDIRQLAELKYHFDCQAFDTPCYFEDIWDPKSDSLYFVLPSTDGDGSNLSIWKLSTDGSPARQIFQIPTNAEPREVDISPNIEWVAYPVKLGSTASTSVELHLASLDGNVDAVYYKGEGEFWTWSPDSLHFLYRHYATFEVGTINEKNEMSFSSVGSKNGPWIDATHFLDENKIIDIEGNMIEIFSFDSFITDTSIILNE